MITIIERDGKWIVQAPDGKVLSTHDNQADAQAQLAALEADKTRGFPEKGAGCDVEEDRSAPRRGGERRTIDVTASEIRSDQVDGRKVIRGVVVRYGSLSSTMRDPKGRPFKERFRPGTFSRALATGADVRFLVNHNRDLVLGRNKVGTLTLSDDPDALRFIAYPPATAIGDHYHELVGRGDIDGVSFRFYKLRDQWSGAGDATVRDLYEADIDDVSIVTYPAYADTWAQAEVEDDPSGQANAERSATHSSSERRDQPRRDPWLDRAAVRLRLVQAGGK